MTRPWGSRPAASPPPDEDDFGFCGTPQEIIEQISQFQAMGVDYFMLDVADFPRLTGLQMLVREVFPKLV